MTATFRVRVQPGARSTGLVGRMSDGTLKLRVSVPPEDGRANRAVVELLALVLGVREGALRVVRGPRTRAKTVEVDGLDQRMVAARITAALAAAGRERA